MTKAEILVLVHVVNIKLNSFNNWKALGSTAWAACTAVAALAALVNPLHKPNKNGKNDNGKDPGDYYSYCVPRSLCYSPTKIIKCMIFIFVPNNKCNYGTNESDATGHPSMFVRDTDFVVLTQHATV